jgi:enediyne biosynthesis protein E4
MNGKALVPWILPELEAKHGIRYSLVSGDFDQDGDDDYIAGNLGDNHRFTVNDKYPLNLYSIDLEPDGTRDPLMTAYWEDKNGKMTEYPVNYLDELWSQSPLLKAGIKDYTPFSYLSFNEMINEKILKRLEFSLYVNTTSSYILWNEKAGFRWEKLSGAVQFAPVKKMITGDFNGDSWPDVLVAGNDYTYDLSSGYYDANKGIVLLNKGMKADNKQSTFEVLAPSKSGILLQGMVESLLWFKGDTSLVVAGINRRKAVVFKHHR